MGALWVLAGTTYREAVAQPVYHIVVWLCAGLILLAHPFTQFYFSQEQYAVREVALATLTISGVILSILMAGLVITREIEKLTVYTLFSKPVGRGAYLIGKFLGITWASGLGMLFLYIWFLLTAWFMGEGLASLDEAIADPAVFITRLDPVGEAVWKFWSDLGLPMFKAALLAWGQTCVLAAFAVSLAVHLPLVVTSGLSFLAFIIGHLTHYLSQMLMGGGSAAGRLLGHVLYFLLPNLTNLNVASLICSPYAVEAVDLSWSYVGLAAVNAASYIAIIFVVACRVFASRDVNA